MNKEELFAEVSKDLKELSTKANMFIDNVRKKAKRLSPFPIAPQHITITTSRSNVWTVEGRYNSYMRAIGFQAYAPVKGSSCNGYIQVTGFRPDSMVLHYTAHFMQRYKERYVDYYHADLKGENLFQYFVCNNPHVLYTRGDNDSYFIISDQGISVGQFHEGRRLMTHITFLGDDELTLRKRLVFEKQIKIYRGALELLRMRSQAQKRHPLVIWNVAKKYDAGFELVKNWHEWNGINVPEDALRQCVDFIEEHHIVSIEQFETLLPNLKNLTARWGD